MTTRQDLEAQRAALIRRIGSLQSRVTFGDRTVEYDLTQAQRALELLDREIRRASEPAGRVNVRAITLNPRSGY